MTVLCFSGALAWAAYFVPIEAGMAIVLWIGVVISAQAFQAVPSNHAPAVVVGLLPGIAAWGAMLAKFGAKAAGLGTPEKPFTEALIPAFNRFDIWAHGMFALEQGFIFASMILSAVTVYIIERQFFRAAAWCAVAAALCMAGLMHSYKIEPADTVLSKAPATNWAIGYAAMAGLLVLAKWITVEDAGH
jgi:AGZA family xanthine/uracil permease-like MFS transporter